MRTRLRPGEAVAVVARRHRVVLLGPFGLALFFAGAFAASLFLRRPWVPQAAGGLALLAAGWAAWRWLNWRADLWAVTSERVIDEAGVLAVRMVDSPLDTVHNVACEQSFWGRVLGFGTLRVQTAAEEGATVIQTVAAPQALREAILEAKERYRGRGGAAGAKAGPGDTRECPYCAETIKAKAAVCRFCGRTL